MLSTKPKKTRRPWPLHLRPPDGVKTQVNILVLQKETASGGLDTNFEDLHHRLAACLQGKSAIPTGSVRPYNPNRECHTPYSEPHTQDRESQKRVLVFLCCSTIRKLAVLRLVLKKISVMPRIPPDYTDPGYCPTTRTHLARSRPGSYRSKPDNSIPQ